MRRHTRHPLHTFRFWFLVVAAVGVAAAWKLDLLPRPVREGDRTSDQAAGRPAGDDDEFADVFVGQSEPLGSAVEEVPPEPVTQTGAWQSESPFGPSRAEFVAAPPDYQAPAPKAAAPDVVLQASSTDDGATGHGPSMQRADSRRAGPALDLGGIDRLIESGTAEGDVAAHRALSELYWQRPEVRPQLKSRIETTARRIYFSPQPHYVEPYEIAAGDRLQQIAKTYQVTWEYLVRLNRIRDPRQIRVGDRLKVIDGPFAAVVDLKDYEITIHAHGHFVCRFPVGIGREGTTPIGTFEVQDKMIDPPYHGPEGTFEGGDPQNPVGRRWISLGDGYGIHGTIDPSSIGRSASRGCIRLLNDDVDLVYDLLTVGSEVVIQR